MTWRAPSEVVAFPNVVLDKVPVILPRFTRLKILKRSHENSRVVFSPSLGRRNAFEILVFTLANPGPANVFRPKFPDTPSGGRAKSARVKTPSWKSLRECGMLLPKTGALG